MPAERSTDILRANDHLASLGSEELEALLERMKPRTLVSGEPLWSVGEDGTGAFVLVSGRVELTVRVQPDGKRTRHIGEPGMWFGVAHLAGDWEHESTAYPVERTEVLELRRTDFRKLFDDHHPAAFALADAVAERLVEEVRDANRRLQDVFGQPAETLRTLRRRTGESGRR